MVSHLISRRRLGLGAGFLGTMVSQAFGAGVCTSVPDEPTAQRPDPQPNANDFSEAELALAFRNHGFQDEALQLPITPVGEHYLLTHFDTQFLSAENYSVAIGGYVSNPQKISLQTIMSRQ